MADLYENYDRHHVLFSLGEILFEYDEDKNAKNIKKHKLSLKLGARVFFDDYRVELDDREHSEAEQRYNVIGYPVNRVSLIGKTVLSDREDLLFVVYTERVTMTQEGKNVTVTRLISVRSANNFERGVYYGNYH